MQICESIFRVIGKRRCQSFVERRLVFGSSAFGETGKGRYHFSTFGRVGSGCRGCCYGDTSNLVHRNCIEGTGWFSLNISVSTLHTPPSTLHTPPSTLHPPHSTLHPPHSTLHTPRWPWENEPGNGPIHAYVEQESHSDILVRYSFVRECKSQSSQYVLIGGTSLGGRRLCPCSNRLTTSRAAMYSSSAIVSSSRGTRGAGLAGSALFLGGAAAGRADFGTIQARLRSFRNHVCIAWIATVITTDIKTSRVPTKSMQNSTMRCANLDASAISCISVRLPITCRDPNCISTIENPTQILDVLRVFTISHIEKAISIHDESK